MPRPCQEPLLARCGGLRGLWHPRPAGGCRGQVRHWEPRPAHPSRGRRAAHIAVHAGGGCGPQALTLDGDPFPRLIFPWPFGLASGLSVPARRLPHLVVPTADGIQGPGIQHSPGPTIHRPHHSRREPPRPAVARVAAVHVHDGSQLFHHVGGGWRRTPPASRSPESASNGLWGRSFGATERSAVNVAAAGRRSPPRTAPGPQNTSNGHWSAPTALHRGRRPGLRIVELRAAGRSGPETQSLAEGLAWPMSVCEKSGSCPVSLEAACALIGDGRLGTSALLHFARA